MFLKPVPLWISSKWKLPAKSASTRQAGSIGGQMVKKMIESYENNLK